jgi:hypothetical protein
MKAYVLLHANQAKQAMLLIAEAQNEATEFSLNQRTHNQLRLIKIYLDSSAPRPQQAEIEWLKDSSVHNEAGSNMMMLYLYKKLVDKKLASPFWLAQ